MAHRFTKRGNDKRMTTVPLALHIPEEAARFVMEKLGLPSLSAAVEEIAKETEHALSNHLGWRTLCVEQYAENEVPEIALVEALFDLDSEGAACYEPAPDGDSLILGRRSR